MVQGDFPDFVDAVNSSGLVEGTRSPAKKTRPSKINAHRQKVCRIALGRSLAGFLLSAAVTASISVPIGNRSDSEKGRKRPAGRQTTIVDCRKKEALSKAVDTIGYGTRVTPIPEANIFAPNGTGVEQDGHYVASKNACDFPAREPRGRVSRLTRRTE